MPVHDRFHSLTVTLPPLSTTFFLAARADDRHRRARAVVEAVTPQFDGGRFAVKRSVGERFVVEADCCADGQDVVIARLLWRLENEPGWRSVPMEPVPNDRWRARFRRQTVGPHRHTVRTRVDAFASWRRDFARREDREDRIGGRR